MKKILITAMTVTLLLSSNINAGSLSTAMSEKWSSVTDRTDSWGKFHALTGMRGHASWTGGHLRGGSMRIRLFSGQFTPPSLSIGCGSVDWALGSLDLVKLDGDKLVEAIKQIGTAGVLYAFKIGMKSMCPTCMSTIESIQSVMDALTADMGTTCKMGQDIAQALEDGGEIKTREGAWKVLKNNSNGYFQNLTKAFTDAEQNQFGTSHIKTEFPNWTGEVDSGFGTMRLDTNSKDAQAEKAKSTATNRDNKELGLPGNILWNALSRNNADGMIHLLKSDTVSETKLKEMIISLLGTIYVGKNTEAIPGKDDPTEKEGSGLKTLVFKHLIEFKDLVDGKEDANVYVCNGENCSKPQSQERTENIDGTTEKLEKIVGFKELISKMWLGDDAANGDVGDGDYGVSTEPGLIAKIIDTNASCAGDYRQCLSATDLAEMNKLSAVSKNLLHMMTSFRNVENAKLFFDGSSDYFSQLIAKEYMDSIIKMVRHELWRLKIEASEKGKETTFFQTYEDVLNERQMVINEDYAQMSSSVDITTIKVLESYERLIGYEATIHNRTK